MHDHLFLAAALAILTACGCRGAGGGDGGGPADLLHVAECGFEEVCFRIRDERPECMRLDVRDCVCGWNGECCERGIEHACPLGFTCVFEVMLCLDLYMPPVDLEVSPFDLGAADATGSDD